MQYHSIVLSYRLWSSSEREPFPTLSAVVREVLVIDQVLASLRQLTGDTAALGLEKHSSIIDNLGK